MRLVLNLFGVLSLILATGCHTSELPSGDNRITQISTIDSLLAGVYDGWYPVDRLSLSGDTGIGTFDALDGEMIMYQGQVYKAASDGRIYRPKAGETTPFASVAFLNPQTALILDEPVDDRELQRRIDHIAPNRNLPVIIQLEGEFEQIKVRSVPPQRKPYPPLVKVTANQPVFDFRDCSGVLVGFRLPPYVKGINVPGYHIHYLSARRDHGGHVLKFRLRRGKVLIGIADRITLLLPRESRAFAGADLKQNRERELEKVEK